MMLYPAVGEFYVFFFPFSKILCFHGIGFGIGINIPESLDISIGWYQIGSIVVIENSMNLKILKQNFTFAIEIAYA